MIILALVTVVLSCVSVVLSIRTIRRNRETQEILRDLELRRRERSSARW